MLSVVILLGVLITLVAILLYTTLRGRQSTVDVRVLESKIKDLHDMFDTRLHKNTEQVSQRVQEQTRLMQQHVHSQFERTAKLIEDVTKGLTDVQSTGREMISFTKQLQSLERTLKNPQRRGMAGEMVLEQIIENILPPGSFATQYTFAGGVRADAVIFLKDEKKVAIDAKFSLENYTRLVEDDDADAGKQLQKDIKSRVQETAKYILPGEGTLDFAFMFIPSESLYYDLLAQKIGNGDTKNLLEQAFINYRVIVVSPTTLLAYLQTVHLGLRSLQVEQHAQAIIARVSELQRHLTKYAAAVHGVGKALSTSVNKYNEAEQQYYLIDKDIGAILDREGERYDREMINRPAQFEKEG